jgi:hypothetical protein
MGDAPMSVSRGHSCKTKLRVIEKEFPQEFSGRLW